MSDYIWEVKIQIIPRLITPPRTNEHEFSINQMQLRIQVACDTIARIIEQLLNSGRIEL